MKLFEKVDSVAHYNYQDSNGGVVGAQQLVGHIYDKAYKGLFY
jgi:hypothetical protein